MDSVYLIAYGMNCSMTFPRVSARYSVDTGPRQGNPQSCSRLSLPKNIPGASFRIEEHALSGLSELDIHGPTLRSLFKPRGWVFPMLTVSCDIRAHKLLRMNDSMG